MRSATKVGLALVGLFFVGALVANAQLFAEGVRKNDPSALLSAAVSTGIVILIPFMVAAPFLGPKVLARFRATRFLAKDPTLVSEVVTVLRVVWHGDADPEFQRILSPTFPINLVAAPGQISLSRGSRSRRLSSFSDIRAKKMSLWNDREVLGIELGLPSGSRIQLLVDGHGAFTLAAMDEPKVRDLASRLRDLLFPESAVTPERPR